MSSSDNVRVKISQLPTDSCLKHPIRDSKGSLILAPGDEFTARIKDRLYDGGMLEVFLHPEDFANLSADTNPPTLPTTTPTTGSAAFLATPPPPPVAPSAESKKNSLAETVTQIKAQAAALAASVPRQITNAGPPVSEQQVSHGSAPFDPQQRQRLARQFAQTTKLVQRIAEQLAAGQSPDDRPLKATAERHIVDLITDTDNALVSSAQNAPNPGVTEHGIRLSLLAMSMAIDMGWDETNVREVGHCGLVHDLGLFRIDERLRYPTTKIAEEDWEEYSNHPLHTLDILKSMKNVSLAVRLAASQIHERPDGTGYPSGLTADEIHPYAALLHVADAYITLTAERHGHRAFLSYDVMVYLLGQVKLNRLDEKATRALLQVITLFPIGSHVRLSDGTEAQVLRRNEKHYTAPIVQRVAPNRKANFDSPDASIIDLADTKMRVMSPLLPPEREEDRLDGSASSKVLWEGRAE